MSLPAVPHPSEPSEPKARKYWFMLAAAAAPAHYTCTRVLQLTLHLGLPENFNGFEIMLDLLLMKKRKINWGNDNVLSIEKHGEQGPKTRVISLLIMDPHPIHGHTQHSLVSWEHNTPPPAIYEYPTLNISSRSTHISSSKCCVLHYDSSPHNVWESISSTTHPQFPPWCKNV